MKRTYWYAAMTKDEVQHSRMTFYEAVNLYRDIRKQMHKVKVMLFIITLSFT
jgi:hypothetical protein